MTPVMLVRVHNGSPISCAQATTSRPHRRRRQSRHKQHCFILVFGRNTAPAAVRMHRRQQLMSLSSLLLFSFLLIQWRFLLANSRTTELLEWYITQPFILREAYFNPRSFWCAIIYGLLRYMHCYIAKYSCQILWSFRSSVIILFWSKFHHITFAGPNNIRVRSKTDKKPFFKCLGMFHPGIHSNHGTEF